MFAFLVAHRRESRGERPVRHPCFADSDPIDALDNQMSNCCHCHSSVISTEREPGDLPGAPNRPERDAPTTATFCEFCAIVLDTAGLPSAGQQKPIRVFPSTTTARDVEWDLDASLATRSKSPTLRKLAAPRATRLSLTKTVVVVTVATNLVRCEGSRPMRVSGVGDAIGESRRRDVPEFGQAEVNDE